MKTSFISVCAAVLIAGVPFFGWAEQASSADIVLENPEFALVIGADATVKSLVHKPSGEECLLAGINVPAFAITQYRPYDNELQLSYPAKSKTFPAKSVLRKGDQLIVEFELVSHIATIGLKITDSYIGFSLEKLDYRIEDYGIKRVTAVDEFTILQLPVKDRVHFGDWLNVIWDKNVAVNLLATGPSAKIDGFVNPGYHLLQGSAIRDVKIIGTGCALITTRTSKLLDRIQQVEEDYGLPAGVQSRKRDAYKWSYYELRGNGKLLQTIDRNIEYALQGGFRMMVVYWTDFAEGAGHFKWRKEFPDGIEDLKVIVSKIKAAGLVPGLHMHYSKASLTDSYVTPVPDHRLNLRRIFTLASELDLASTTVAVEENPDGCTLEERRRYLKIGNELVTYKDYTTTPPYQFQGCQRATLGTTSQSFAVGYKFGLLDVDTWPVFVRFDQRTGIQREVAERIGALCKGAGFEFLYFDGAEDVHPPYWFHVANAQYEVYKALDPKPLLSEGAMKAHFSWHMLTRGNAFDHFPPEVIKEATRRYPLAEAAHLHKDFTSLNFGWMSYVAPGEKTTGTQPDMYEYVTSHAAGWDCPVSLVARLDHMDKHPRTADNLEVIKRWEDVRNSDFLTDEIKVALRDPVKEHILLLNEKGDFELQECEQIPEAAQGSSGMRAFIFERHGSPYVVYWHPFGEAQVEMPVDPDQITVCQSLGSPISVTKKSNSVMIPLGGRRYIQSKLSRQETVTLIKKASVVPD